MTESEILRYALESGMLDLTTVKADMRVKKRIEILQNHPHKVWQGSNGFWYTHIGEGKERKKVKRKTRDSLDDYLVAYYDTTPTFKLKFDLWVERQRLCCRSDNTIYRYQTDYKRFIEGKDFENLKIDEITEEDISKLFKEVNVNTIGSIKS